MHRIVLDLRKRLNAPQADLAEAVRRHPERLVSRLLLEAADDVARTVKQTSLILCDHVPGEVLSG